MRGFISLLFAAALAAHLGPAGAPSLGPSPTCGDAVGIGGRAGEHILYPAAALGAPQAESTSDGRERTGGAVPRRALSETRTPAPQVAAGAARRYPDARTPPSLQGFPGHPATAPPLAA